MDKSSLKGVGWPIQALLWLEWACLHFRTSLILRSRMTEKAPGFNPAKRAPSRSGLQARCLAFTALNGLSN